MQHFNGNGYFSITTNTQTKRRSYSKFKRCKYAKCLAWHIGSNFLIFLSPNPIFINSAIELDKTKTLHLIVFQHYEYL